MKVCVVRNVEFEGPGLIAEWVEQRGHELFEALAPSGDYPAPDEIDLLVIMGGPMAADDESAHPWLHAEKVFVAETIASGKRVLGVCLGAQILAEVAGGVVSRGAHSEVGWFPLALTDAGRVDPVFSRMPDGLVAGHWHGDTFSVPPGAVLTASSDGCANQGFSMLGGDVVGVQFHLEWTSDDVYNMVEQCASDLGAGPFSMDAAQVLDGIQAHQDACREALWGMLDAMAYRPTTD